MIVDTSALIAILRLEDGHERAARALADQSSSSMAAGTLVEAVTVMVGRREPRGASELFKPTSDAGIEVEPTNQTDAEITAEARLRYGKGMGGTARPDPAKRTDEPFLWVGPLFWVGNDFARTDIPLMPLPEPS